MEGGVFFIYIQISNNLQFLALATVYGHLATVYYLLQKRVPTVNQIVQNGCLQFISFLGHYFTPATSSSSTSSSPSYYHSGVLRLDQRPIGAVHLVV